MALAGKDAPATPWRAFFAFILAVTTAGAGQPPGRAPDLAQVGLPGPEEAAKILEQFRQAGIPGEYYLEFDLVTMPRRGDTKTFAGRLWGSRNAAGVITRVELTDGQGQKHRLLIQNGARPAVWQGSGGKVAPLGAAALFTPLIPGVELTPFDLQMPYLYWPDAKVQAIKRVLGRPAHAFLFRAPPAIAEQGGIGAVRAYLDAQYNAMTQTELLDRAGHVVKTFSLVSLKTIDQQTLPKSVDFRNDRTRDKTRMTLTAAALHLDLGPAPFTPDALAEDIRPPSGHVVKID